jgi:hypothetical protein
MKEEEYRDALALGKINGKEKKQRFKISDILGWSDSYKGNPGGTKFTDLGQMVFALNMATGSTCLGQCVFGCQLIPWGVCCYMPCNVSSACGCQGSVTCGFSLGTSSTVYVALGSITGCGATLFRRIA